MYPAERYLALYERFAGPEGAGAAHEVTLEELAEALYCTRRNAKLIVRRLVETGLIEWKAGRGRGIRSRIVFLADKEPFLLELVRKMAERDEYNEAFSLIEAYGGGTSVKERFADWLNGQFGYRREATDGDENAADKLRIPVYRPVLTLDPAEVYYAFDSHMVRQLFDRLIRCDPAEGRMIPSLAHTWEHNEDATEWTFFLRKGVRFHHGREMSSQDVVHTMERLQSSVAYSWMMRAVKCVEALGPRVVRVRLTKPNWIFPRFACSTAMSIVPQELASQQGAAFSRHPVGSGPFRLAYWNGNRLELAAHRDYFLGRPHLDSVEIVSMPDHIASASSSPQMDWMQLIPDHDAREEKRAGGWQSIEKLNQGCTLLTWNMGKPGPQRIAAFRRAVDLLIDRSGMIRELGGERACPARGFRPPESADAVQDAYDPKLAKELLKEAAYDGTPLTLATYSIHAKDAEWIRTRCESLGIPVIIRMETLLSIRDPEAVSGSDCLLYGVCFAEDEVCEIETYEQSGSFIKEHMEAGLARWVREQVDEALAVRDADTRRALLAGIENRLRVENHVLFLLHKKLNTYYHPTVKGAQMNELGWTDFKEVWLDKHFIPS